MENAGVSSRVRIVGAAAALLAMLVLLAGVVGLSIISPGLGLRNWLVILFGVNAGVSEFSYDSLRVINPLDIAVLVLAALSFVSFWPDSGQARKVGIGIAAALPLAGIVVLVATSLAGRCGLMGGGLVVSFLMLGDRSFRPLAFLGIVANALLLVGDFTTSGSPMPVVAILMATGYVLLIVWFPWLAARLLLVRRPTPTGEA